MFGTQHTKKSVVRRGKKQERNIKPSSMILCYALFTRSKANGHLSLRVKIVMLISFSTSQFTETSCTQL
jgi:hypothetical protein